MPLMKWNMEPGQSWRCSCGAIGRASADGEVHHGVESENVNHQVHSSTQDDLNVAQAIDAARPHYAGQAINIQTDGWVGSIGRGVRPSPEEVELKRRAMNEPIVAEPYCRASRVLKEAENLITGDRAHAYGHPKINFTRVAGLWSSYLGITLNARQVAMMMILFKASRDAAKPGRDNLTDICGYAALAEVVDEPK